MKKLVKILGCIALVTPFFAHAARDYVYVGASIGYSELETSLGSGEASADNPSADDSDTAYKIYTGYLYNKYLGAELSYVDLGEATLSEHWSEGGGTGTYYGKGHATSIALTAVGYYKVNRKVKLFGKLGANRWSYEYDEKRTGNSPYDRSLSDDSVGITFGLGGMYYFGDFSLRLEAEAYKVKDNYIELYSIGAQYKF